MSKKPRASAIHLRQIPDGRWLGRARLYAADGSIKHVQRTGATQGAVRTKINNEIMAFLRQPMPMFISGATSQYQDLSEESLFEEAVEFWLEEVRLSGRVKPGVFLTYSRRARLYVNPVLGKLPLKLITAGILDRHVKELQALSSSKARQAKFVINQVCDVAVRAGVYTHNPAKSIARLLSNRKTVRAVTQAQVDEAREAIRAYTSGRRYGPVNDILEDFFEIATGTGCRPGEILAIRKCDVDAANSILYVTGTIKYDDDKKLFRQDEPKSVSSIRGLKVPSHTASVLRRRIASMSARNPEALIFTTRNGTPIAPNNLRRSWRAAFKRAGIDSGPFSPKALRKYVGTKLQRSLGAEATKAQLGHHSVKVAEAFYIEVAAVNDFADELEN